LQLTSQRTITRRLIDLAMPIIGINVLQHMVLVVDTIMIGHLDNAETLLTSLSFAAQIIFLLMVLMAGLTIGTVATVARAHGAGDSARVNHVLLQSTMLTVLAGLGVGVAGNLFAPQLMLLLGASPETLAAGLEFLRPMLAGVVFNYLMTLYAAIMRGVGNTRVPFLVSLLTTSLNTGINFLLIYGKLGFPALGIQGAALGTIIAWFVGAMLLGVLLRRGTVGNLVLPLRIERIDRELAGQLARIGAPAACDMVVLHLSFSSIVGMLGRIDELAVAAHGIGLRIQALAFLPGLAISQATAAMVAQALGGGSAEQARQVLRGSVLLCTTLISLLGLILIVFAHPIVSLFNVAAGTPLSEYSVMWIRLLGYGMPLTGWQTAVTGLLQGAGATWLSLRINLYATLLFQIPLSFALGFTFGLGAFGVWLAFPLSFVLRVWLVDRAYRGNTWAKVGVHA
jgi:putative MATE family efflux protein